MDALRFDVGMWRHDLGKWLVVLMEQNKRDVFESAGVPDCMVFRSDLGFFHLLQHLYPGRPLKENKAQTHNNQIQCSFKIPLFMSFVVSLVQ